MSKYKFELKDSKDKALTAHLDIEGGRVRLYINDALILWVNTNGSVERYCATTHVDNLDTYYLCNIKKDVLEN